jgi:hypothetical protein
MTTTRRSFLRRATALLLGAVAAPRLAAGAADAIPFRVVRTVLLRTAGYDVSQRRTQGNRHESRFLTGRRPSEPTPAHVHAMDHAARTRWEHGDRMRHQADIVSHIDYGQAELRLLVEKWRLPRTSVLLQRMDTGEYGVVSCDKREALLVAFCHDSVSLELPPAVTPDPAAVKSWYATEKEAVDAAGGLWLAAIMERTLPKWGVPLTAEADIGPSWEDVT